MTPLVCRAAVAALVLAVAACGSSSAASDHPGKQGSTSYGPITVLAAASLTEAMTAQGKAFEATHPGARVSISFAASSTIVQQVNQGAPADLVALASEAAATPLDRSKPVKDGMSIIATNTLEIATPPGNPGQVTGISDLGKRSLKVVLCAAQVPCGKAAAASLRDAKVKAHVVSYEHDVKTALSKVALGEADAAIVYHSDVVTAADRVEGIPIPDEVNQVLKYPLIRVSDDATAREFAAYVGSAAGQKPLRDSGFGAP